jgi:hypothetical protein
MQDFDRRAGFFFITAVLCLLLVPVTLPKLRWVGEVLVLAQVLLGLLSLADHLSRRRRTNANCNS